MKNMILASSSSVYGSGYLAYLHPALKTLFEGVTEIVFIPFARPNGISHDAYTEIAQRGFEFLDIPVVGLHSFENQHKAIADAQAIFVGGGNTFVLVDELYKRGVFSELQEVIESGTPYLGTSAGSNICGLSMQTTNDMPIVKPISFKTLGSIPMNINAHYIEPEKDSKHKGETRETRINEFHNFHATPVLGLREGSWLEIKGSAAVLRGVLPAVLFRKNLEKLACMPNSDIFLLL